MRPQSSLSSDSKLLGRLIADLRPAFQQAANGQPLQFDTAQQSYAYQLFTRTSDLIAAFDTLHEIIFYVKRYPTTTTYRRNGPTKPDWYRYHIENFYVRLRGVSDRLVAVVAAAVVLEARQRPKFTEVLKHPVVCGTTLQQRLKTIGEKTQEFKELRDRIIHESRYSDTDLAQLGFLTLAAAEDPGFQADARWMEWFFVQDLQGRLEGILSTVETHCREFLDDVVPIYLATLPNVRFRS